MDIVIIGGGIAGLSTYLHLRKYLPNPEVHSIAVLERHAPSAADDTTPMFSGGLGVGPNGMRVLRRLSEGIHADVEKAGFACDYFSFRTAGGWRLGTWKACTEVPTKEGMVMIDRRTLWGILRQRVPDTAIRTGARVSKIQEDGDVVLANGEVLKADLVIGADGVWSTTRAFVVQDGEQGREPMFQSLMNIGGSVPTSYLENLKHKNEPHCVMTFGAKGFVGYTPVSTSVDSSSPGSRGMWWATYTEDPDSASRKTTHFPKDPSLRTAFKQRHGDWADPTIQRIIKGLTEEDVETSSDGEDSDVTLNLHTPTWIVPKLPRWHRNRVVLIGDAAHALPSTSGQGISQALEDTAALSLLLADAVRDLGTLESVLSDDQLTSVLEEYQAMRKPHVEKILDHGLKRQNSKREMSVIGTCIMYFVMFLIFRVFGMRDEWRQEYGVEEEIKKLSEGVADAEKLSKDTEFS